MTCSDFWSFLTEMVLLHHNELNYNTAIGKPQAPTQRLCIFYVTLIKMIASRRIEEDTLQTGMPIKIFFKNYFAVIGALQKNQLCYPKFCKNRFSRLSNWFVRAKCARYLLYACVGIWVG